MKTEDLFEAIRLISEQVVDNKNIQQTVTGIIKSARKSNGAFDVEYQGMVIEAFPLDSGSVYKLDDMVYLVLPNGSINDTRLIMGLVSRTRTATTNLPEIIEETVVTTGRNYIETPTSATLTSVSSKVPIVVSDLFKLHHNQGQSHFRIKSNITTDINPNNLTNNFRFGIKVTIKYKEESTARVFDFNNLQMAGAIYNLTGYTQDKTFPLEIGKTVDSIVAEYYATDTRTYPVTIKFENSAIELLSDILNDIINNKKYSIEMSSSRGTVFEDTDTGDTILKCKVYSDGMEVDPFGTLFDYKWIKKIGSQETDLPAQTPAHQLSVYIGDLSIEHYECQVSLK